MKRFILIALILSGAAAVARAACNFTYTCSLDGSPLTLEKTYYNGLHQSQKWSHKSFSGEYHYIIVQCN
jgi:hypothetical protein